MSVDYVGKHPADRTRKIIASPRPKTGAPLGATSRDRAGQTYLDRDTSRAFGADQVKMTAGMIEAAAERESEAILYGKRAYTGKRRAQKTCPGCGLQRSVKGLCDCNS